MGGDDVVNDGKELDAGRDVEVDVVGQEDVVFLEEVEDFLHTGSPNDHRVGAKARTHFAEFADVLAARELSVIGRVVIGPPSKAGVGDVLT